MLQIPSSFLAFLQLLDVTNFTRMQEMKQMNFKVANYGVHETEGESMVKEVGLSRVEIDN